MFTYEKFLNWLESTDISALEILQSDLQQIIDQKRGTTN